MFFFFFIVRTASYGLSFNGSKITLELVDQMYFVPCSSNIYIYMCGICLSIYIYPIVSTVYTPYCVARRKWIHVLMWEVNVCG